MFEIPGQYVNDPDFQEFLSRAFRDTAVVATMEELAEFAFGDVDTAISKFEKYQKNPD